MRAGLPIEVCKRWLAQSHKGSDDFGGTLLDLGDASDTAHKWDKMLQAVGFEVEWVA
jgi:hypothetical protein